MIYLIGVAHKVQYANDRSDPVELNRFADFLEFKARELNIGLIAEELNEEVLREKKATSCTALDIALRLSIEHRFCDPDRSERRSLGIPADEEIYAKLVSGGGPDGNLREAFRREKARHFWIREAFWLGKLRDRLDRQILFICGADHIPGFSTLLSDKGHEAEVLIRDWEERPR